MKETLDEHRKQRDLVSIRRGAIDDHPLQAFVLDVSDQLVALQYVCDFNLDGLMFLRVDDITSVKSSATETFQKGLLEHEGVLDRVPFGVGFELDSWRDLFAQLVDTFPILIVERECKPAEPLFIGSILKVTKSGVLGHYFSGAANWAKRPEGLKFKDITCCQVGTNYIEFYRRHFARTPESLPGSPMPLVARTSAPADSARMGPLA